MASNPIREDYFVLGKGRPRRWPALMLATALLVALVLVPAIARSGKGGKGHGNDSSASDLSGA